MRRSRPGSRRIPVSARPSPGSTGWTPRGRAGGAAGGAPPPPPPPSPRRSGGRRVSPRAGPDRLDAEGARRWSGGPLLLLPPNVLLDPLSVRRLLAARDPGDGIALEESKGSFSPILLAPPALSAAIWDRLVEGAPLGDELELRVRQGRMTLVVGAGFFVPVLDEATRSQAEATLFRSLGIS